jgi:hypothetical protein
MLQFRESGLLGSTLPLELHPQSCFALVIFQVGSHGFLFVLPWATSDCDPSTYGLPHSWD